MHDLDTQLADLRRDLRGSVRQPAFAQIAVEGRRRTIRRRLQLVVLVAAVFATGALPFLARIDRTEPARAGLARKSQVLSADFLDANTGFVLGAKCQDMWNSCVPWLLAATDNGAWEQRTAPPIDVQAGTDGLVALGRATLVAEDLLPDNSIRRYFSDDAGRTWTPVTSSVDTKVDAIPPGAVLDTKREAQHGGPTELCRGGVSVVLPTTGQSALLAVQPDLVPLWCQRYPDVNGTWWVGGRIPATDRIATASSRDNGRSWQVRELPGFAGATPANEIGWAHYPAIRVVSSRSNSFAVLTNPIGAQELAAIYGNTGPGWAKTWQRQLGDATWPSGVLGSAVAGADGKLLIPSASSSESGRLVNAWLSADGGRTLHGEYWGPGPMSGKVEWTRGGYVSVAGQADVYRSLEGVSWQRVVFPSS